MLERLATATATARCNGHATPTPTARKLVRLDCRHDRVPVEDGPCVRCVKLVRIIRGRRAGVLATIGLGLSNAWPEGLNSRIRRTASVSLPAPLVYRDCSAIIIDLPRGT